MKEWFSDLRDRDPELFVITANAIATTLHAGLLGLIWLTLGFAHLPSSNDLPSGIDIRFVFAASLAFMAFGFYIMLFYPKSTVVNMLFGATSFTMLAAIWLGVSWWVAVLVWIGLGLYFVRMCASVAASIALQDETWDLGRHRWCTALAIPILGQVLIPFDVIRRQFEDPRTYGR